MIPRSRIPVIIICHNVLTDLLRLIDWLERTGHERLVLLDNASTYPPLLEYYGRTAHDVIRLPRNDGQRAPWLSGLAARIGRSSPFVVTDPDVLPDPDCPPDAVEHFQTLLLQHPRFDKAGFGLCIDDLPPCYPHRDAVRRWEAAFWRTEISPGVYAAPIDTTFAVYRPRTPYKTTGSLRTAAPYLARHLPWYRDPRQPDEETRYFLEHRRNDVGWWNRAALTPDIARRTGGG
ncbi:MAG TPA: glycosyltransferase family 2 protein [Thermoanaerobaculia bacterium]|nr:glycosyltransferase family 2 protein [Thermoanaerobaculia bacterium]